MFTLLTNGDRSQLDDRPARHLRPGQPPRPRNWSSCLAWWAARPV